MLTGSARMVQEAKDKARTAVEQQTAARRRRELEQEQAVARAQLEAMQLKTAALEEELKMLASERTGPACRGRPRAGGIGPRREAET